MGSLPDSAGDDPLNDYHRSVERWTEADRDHHVAQTAVACGSGSTEDMATAAARLEWAEGEFLVARHRIGRRLAESLRLAAEDETTAYAVMLQLLSIMRPALEPVADRLAECEERVGNLELLASKRGVNR